MVNRCWHFTGACCLHIQDIPVNKTFYSTTLVPGDAKDVKHVGVLIIVTSNIILSALAGGSIDCVCTVWTIIIKKTAGCVCYWEVVICDKSLGHFHITTDVWCVSQ